VATSTEDVWSPPTMVRRSLVG